MQAWGELALTGGTVVENPQIFDWSERPLHIRPLRPVGGKRLFKIVKLLPPEGDEHQYRIKSVGEAFERVAKKASSIASASSKRNA